MKPHVCPVCNGVGKVVKGGSYTTTVPIYDRCAACNGECVVWEPAPLGDFPVHPSFPTNPVNPPTFTPNPEVGLTFPKDFKFPKHVEETTTDQLIKQIEGWLKDLKKTKKKSKNRGKKR